MSVRGYIQTLLNALPVGTRQPVQQAFDALYTERSGVTAGTYGSSSAIPVLTIDARGRVTDASAATFTTGSGAVVLIEEQTPSGVSSVTFSSLGAYTHLEIRWSARGDQAANNTTLNVQFNGDTGANYDRQLVQAFATTPSASESLGSTTAAVGNVVAATGTASTPGTGVIQIYDYRGSSFHKMFISSNGWARLTTSGNFGVQLFAGRWRATSPITSITLGLAAGNFVSGSKFSLYGVT